MNKVIEPRYDETYITETLENGLNVIVWHKPFMCTTSCVLATPYGALDFGSVLEDGTEIHHHSGIAHFLEHKMFEKEGRDVMTDFSMMGASCNAFTSYNETMYTFSTSDPDIKEPLNLLLDFVQELSITEASVEKEKGIIIQELMMYLQMPDSRLYFETFKALFHQHPFKYDIGGSPESVSATSKEELEECYRLNYHPSKMLLVCVGPQNPEEVLTIVKENQMKKTFDPVQKVSRLKFNEPKEVAIKQHFIPMEVNTQKVAVAFKLDCWANTSKERVHDEWAIRCALEAHFSTMNPDYQTWIDQKLINDYFDYDISLEKDSAFLLFVSETDDKEEFEQFVLKQMQECLTKPVPYEVLKQLMKRYYGQAMRIFNNVEDIAVNAARNYFNEVSLFEVLNLLNQLDQKQVEEALSHLSLENHCLVAIVPQN